MSYAFKLLQATNNFTITTLSVRFHCRENHVDLVLDFENHFKLSKVTYTFKEEDTLVEVTEYNKLLVKEKHYIKVVCDDLLYILKNAKFAEKLDIGISSFNDDEESVAAVNRIYKQFRNRSETAEGALFVHSLGLQVENVSQLRSVLPCFNPNKLKELIIHNKTIREKTIDFRDIVETDHWKNATHIKLEGVSVPFDNFSHCEDVRIHASKVSANDIQTLVEIAYKGSSLRFFYVRCDSFDEDVTEQLLDSLIGKTQTNKFGKPVRLIGDKLEFVHNPTWKTIGLFELSDKKDDESMEDLTTTVTGSSKAATLCFSNRLIMEKIVKHLDFFEMVVLRKVSRGSRQCVEFFKPDPQLMAIKISVKPGFIFLEVFDRSDCITILYSAPGSDIEESTFTYTEHKSDINNFSSDLVHILKNQTSALKELHVTLEPSCGWDMDFMAEQRSILSDWQLSGDQFIETLNRTFFSCGTLFPVEKFILTTICLKQAALTLQNVDPVTLKSIELRSNSFLNIVQPFDDLASLEQCKNADELKMENFRVQCGLEKLIHFAKVDIGLYSISLEDVLYLKEKFLMSSKFRQFKAAFHETDVNNSIFEVNFLGAPRRRVDDITNVSEGQPSVWFFPYARTMEDLQIRYYRMPKLFMFNRVPRQF